MCLICACSWCSKNVKINFHLEDFWSAFSKVLKTNTGCLLSGVTKVISNISLVFEDRDLVLYMKVLYYGTFDNQKMI